PDYQPTAYDDDWEDIPASGPVPKWIGGALVPLLLVSYGVICFATGHGVLPGHSGSMDLYGVNSTALGLASMSLGLFLHCHYFWGTIFHLSPWAVLGKIMSLIVLIGSLGYLIVHVGVFGR